jgi:hypothetical protein
MNSENQGIYLQSASCQNLCQKHDFTHPQCGHNDAMFTVTRLVNGTPTIICQNCYDFYAEEDRLAQLSPIVLHSCLFCDSSVDVREDRDVGGHVCDQCRMENLRLLNIAERNRTPASDLLPDEMAPGVFMGCKDCAYNLSGLKSKGITRVLICCAVLPAYHLDTTDGIRYHRIPMHDSLAQNLASYLQSARAFIAQGLLEGEGCLVHCNAGASRSGAVISDWLLESKVIPSGMIEDAIAHGKERRRQFHPNSNFIDQLRDFVHPVTIPT